MLQSGQRAYRGGRRRRRRLARGTGRSRSAGGQCFLLDHHGGRCVTPKKATRPRPFCRQFCAGPSATQCAKRGSRCTRKHTHTDTRTRTHARARARARARRFLCARGRTWLRSAAGGNTQVYARIGFDGLERALCARDQRPDHFGGTFEGLDQAPDRDRIFPRVEGDQHRTVDGKLFRRVWVVARKRRAKEPKRKLVFEPLAVRGRHALRGPAHVNRNNTADATNQKARKQMYEQTRCTPVSRKSPTPPGAQTTTPPPPTQRRTRRSPHTPDRGTVVLAGVHAGVQSPRTRAARRTDCRSGYLAQNPLNISSLRSLAASACRCLSLPLARTISLFASVWLPPSSGTSARCRSRLARSTLRFSGRKRSRVFAGLCVLRSVLILTLILTLAAAVAPPAVAMLAGFRGGRMQPPLSAGHYCPPIRSESRAKKQGRGGTVGKQ